MKIQLASTLPFTPVQMDIRHPTPRRSVGLLFGLEDGVEYSLPVYEFRHCEDMIEYQVNPAERVNAETGESLLPLSAAGSVFDAARPLVWIEHEESLSYKPYSFVVMNAMTKLVGEWDGVVYRTPSGERLRESAFQATLQIIDSCVSAKSGLWVMVNLVGETKTGAALDSPAVRQLGWVPVGL
ncbi:MAG: hypothetical protein AB8B97_18950 [Granulosicoccus sp.]